MGKIRYTLKCLFFKQHSERLVEGHGIKFINVMQLTETFIIFFFGLHVILHCKQSKSTITVYRIGASFTLDSVEVLA